MYHVVYVERENNERADQKMDILRQGLINRYEMNGLATANKVG